MSPSLISTVTDAVFEDVKAWQSRPFEALGPIVYLDAIHVKMRTAGHVQTQAVYLTLALALEGDKELLGPWVGDAEGAKVWLAPKTPWVDEDQLSTVDCLVASTVTAGDSPPPLGAPPAGETPSFSG